MNILKIKSIFKLFIALALVGVLITSCEKENLVNDSITLTEGSSLEVKQNDLDLNEISSRKPCIPSAPNENFIDNVLYNYLAENIIRFDNNPIDPRADDVRARYGTIVRHLNKRLCLDLAEEGEINWDGTAPETYQNIPNCPGYAIDALLRLQFDIERFLINPSCGNKVSLQIRFVDYVRTLNTCFTGSFKPGFPGFDEDKYACKLMLADCPCDDYYYQPNCSDYDLETLCN